MRLRPVWMSDAVVLSNNMQREELWSNGNTDKGQDGVRFFSSFLQGSPCLFQIEVGNSVREPSPMTGEYQFLFSNLSIFSFSFMIHINANALAALLVLRQTRLEVRARAGNKYGVTGTEWIALWEFCPWASVHNISTRRVMHLPTRIRPRCVAVRYLNYYFHACARLFSALNVILLDLEPGKHSTVHIHMS